MESLHSPHTQVSRDQTVYSWLLLMVPSCVPSPDSTLHYASLLCLHLLRAALPFIKLAGGTTSQQPPSDLLSLPSAILAHLCGLLDSADVDTTVQRLAQDIVVEGVVVFFPDASTRREYLLNMIGAVLVRWRKGGGGGGGGGVLTVLPSLPLPLCCRRTANLDHGGSSLKLSAATSANQTATHS